MKDHIVKVPHSFVRCYAYTKETSRNEGIMATYHALFIHITKKGRDEMKQVQTKRDWKNLHTT